MKKKDKEKDKNQSEQPELSDEQLEMFSAHMEENGEDRSTIEPFDQSTKARIIRYAKNHKALTTVFIVAVVSIVAVISLLIAYYISLGKGFANKSNFIIRIGENKYEADYEDVMINDIMYIDVTEISKIDNIQISGDTTSRKYTLPNLQYMRFEKDSDLAIVDGTYIEMSGKAIVDEGSCLVPIDFLSKIFETGLKFKINEKKNTIEIKRIQIGNNPDKTPIYQPISIKNVAQKDTSNVAYEKFGIDIIPSLMYIDPDKEEYLLLINNQPQNALPREYEPEDLVQLNCDTNPVHSKSYYSLRAVPAEALSLMMTAMNNSGIEEIQVSSSYRSYDRQLENLNYQIRAKMSKDNLSYEKAREEILKTVALPGHSEHQTGLCVDFVQGTTSLTEDFENSTSFKWLSENAHKFGFILRYPKDKTNITSINYEPWHYRFVGRTVASRIYEAGICYEEYVALTK